MGQHEYGRRRFLRTAGGALSGVGLACAGWPQARAEGTATGAPSPLTDAQLLEETGRRTFQFFFDTTDAATGMAPDYAPDCRIASIAAMGFALTALPVGASRGWVGREAACERALATLRFLKGAPQGPDARGCSGHRGFYYHFLDMETGTRHGDSELSSIDTALLMMGVRCVGSYFDGASADEAEVRSLADTLSEAVDWPWMQAHGPGICMGWRPESGFLDANWIGFNEATLMVLLALGSREHPVGADAWGAWTSGYEATWGRVEGITQLSFGALFAHQFTQVWVDLRGIRDAWMAEKGLDYFENTRRVALAHRAYAKRNPMDWEGYGADIWGLSACDGPAYTRLRHRGTLREFRGYSARGVGLKENFDDGTLCPAASIGCLPHLPEESMACMQAMHRRYGSALWGRYGYYDAYSPSFRYDVPLHSGRVAQGLCWVDERYYGINQGPLLGLLENSRTGLLWNLSRRDPVIRRGLERAGFRGGWLA